MIKEHEKTSQEERKNARNKIYKKFLIPQKYLEIAKLFYSSYAEETPRVVDTLSSEPIFEAGWVGYEDLKLRDLLSSEDIEFYFKNPEKYILTASGVTDKFALSLVLGRLPKGYKGNLGGYMSRLIFLGQRFVEAGKIIDINKLKEGYNALGIRIQNYEGFMGKTIKTEGPEGNETTRYSTLEGNLMHESFREMVTRDISNQEIYGSRGIIPIPTLKDYKDIDKILMVRSHQVLTFLLGMYDSIGQPRGAIEKSLLEMAIYCNNSNNAIPNFLERFNSLPYKEGNRHEQIKQYFDSLKKLA